MLSVDPAYKFGWLPGRTITRGIEGLAIRCPWLPSAYVAQAVQSALAAIDVGQADF